MSSYRVQFVDQNRHVYFDHEAKFIDITRLQTIIDFNDPDITEKYYLPNGSGTIFRSLDEVELIQTIGNRIIIHYLSKNSIVITLNWN